MGRPGYYEVGSPSSLIEFPRAERPESNTVQVQRTRLSFETEMGQLWNYAQIQREAPELIFRVTESQLEVFRTLDEVVFGDVLPFYFVPDVDSPSVALLVYKEAEFKPRRLGLGVVDGIEVPIYEYTMSMRAAVTGSFVSA